MPDKPVAPNDAAAEREAHDQLLRAINRLYYTETKGPPTFTDYKWALKCIDTLLEADRAARAPLRDDLTVGRDGLQHDAEGARSSRPPVPLTTEEPKE